jgi:peptide/nickel transport system ATP-binding protein
MSEPLLAIHDLQVRFDSTSDPVKGLSLTLNSGEIHCLVGESGSGKTITAQSIMRLLDQAEYGEFSQILLDQEDLLTLPEISLEKIRGKKIAMIFQEPMTSLNPVMTIGNQIVEALQIHASLSNEQAILKTLELLHDVGMGEPQHIYTQYPHQLSGGMRQRAMIAMALTGDPEILIADEPTTALDVTIQAQVLLLIQNLALARNMAVLFITHDLAVVSSIADTISVMFQGKIVEHSTRDVFFKGPEHPYSIQLLNCAKDLTLPIVQNEKNASPVILKVSDLSVYYPIKSGFFQRTIGYLKAVDTISFSLNKGETLAIVGESGSGKSTTAFALLQLIDYAKGEIIFNDRDLLTIKSKELRSLRRYLQMIFQDPMGSLNPRMTIREILSEGWDALGLYRSDSRRETLLIDLLRSVSLPDNCLDHYPHEFSGGQHQRIAIARAIAMQPQIIVCDEPTSALDVTVQAQIIDLLKTLQQERDLSYVFISHNIPVVSHLAHYIAVMYLGKIVEYGTTEDIMHHPKHPYTQALLACVPVLSEASQPLQSLPGEIPSLAHPPAGCHFHPRCPYAMPQCKISYPDQTHLNKTHLVRCYLYGDN